MATFTILIINKKVYFHHQSTETELALFKFMTQIENYLKFNIIVNRTLQIALKVATAK